MSWNVRRRLRRPSPRAADRWENRAPRVRQLLRTERPTLLGAQEALTDQAEFLRESLGPEYRMLGRGRGAGGRGEGCPILYDAARLELLDWDQAALSAHAVREVISTHGLPAVVTGDFNAGVSSAPLRELLADGMLNDSWAAAQNHDSLQWDTFSNYRAPRQRRGRIDWILTSPEIGVVRAAINTHQYYGGWASDHLPVQVRLLIPGALVRAD